MDCMVINAPLNVEIVWIMNAFGTELVNVDARKDSMAKRAL